MKVPGMCAKQQRTFWALAAIWVSFICNVYMFLACRPPRQSECVEAEMMQVAHSSTTFAAK
jgi:hypothetical protein